MSFRRFMVFVVLVPGLLVPLAAQSIAFILNQAAEFIGTPYIRGGTDPQGFDCSGFVFYLYKADFPTIPRVSRQMASAGEQVLLDEWQAGDLLFYATGTDPNRITHVAIWYGDERLIHCISNGPETGVVITSASSRYWRQRYVTARRVLSPADSPLEPPVGDSLSEASATAAPTLDDSSSSASSSTAAGLTTDSSPGSAELSPWDNYEGLLTGDDYQNWKTAEDEAFEEFKAHSE
ncbi:MAG: hypothetical protein B0D92_00985 [Spirochaeta sp. LUC14_002_19_P3]|nr:MAG: hypothetical protein B0D92_00985 [Spirochaeta sp. LUC14_002_19_P3]